MARPGPVAYARERRIGCIGRTCDACVYSKVELWHDIVCLGMASLSSRLHVRTSLAVLVLLNAFQRAGTILMPSCASPHPWRSKVWANVAQNQTQLTTTGPPRAQSEI